ncbi:MAG: radical SAM protein [Marinisporobacter sp.]|nr:radical SAM protein [Marinisporobacter sp.]
MKVYIIKACAKSIFKEYKKYMAAPPQSIFSLASCTPENIKIDMIDETVDMKVDYKNNADIVAIFFSTPDAMRGYEIADEFRKLGKTVVLGGLHVKFNQEEALGHGDSLLIGECEEIWEELLLDYRNGAMKKSYEREIEMDLSKVKPFPKDIIPLSQYNYVWSVLVSRGCVNRCSYCLVNRFFKSMRFRPIDDIIEEIKNSGAKIIELHSDNLTADREYAKELFTKLIPLNIKWVGETTADFADDDELLELAAKSGLSYLLLGLETPARKELSDMDKGFMKIERVKNQIKKLHEHGIMIDSAMLFGFAGHTKDIFEETVKYIKEIDLDVTHAVVPIPFPGTKFYDQLDKEGKIVTKDWAKYDGRHLVYKHDHLTEKDIEEGIKYFEDRAYTLKATYRYYKFVAKMSAKAFTSLT